MVNRQLRPHASPKWLVVQTFNTCLPDFPSRRRRLVSQLEVALGKVDRMRDEGVRDMLTYAHERTTMAGAHMAR